MPNSWLENIRGVLIFLVALALMALPVAILALWPY